jgi:hypothetical protein
MVEKVANLIRAFSFSQHPVIGHTKSLAVRPVA